MARQIDTSVNSRMDDSHLWSSVPSTGELHSLSPAVLGVPDMLSTTFQKSVEDKAV